MNPSPLEAMRLRGRTLLLKRDDRLRPYPGNKGRKLAALRDHDWSRVARIVSHGGHQSNAMLSLARLAADVGRPLHYYAKPLPRWLRAQPIGNLREALALGMQLHEVPHLERSLLPLANAADTLFIPQGVAMAEAEAGFAALARELESQVSALGHRQVSLFLPSGTGTSALWLQRHLPWTVYTTPCVGDAGYLQAQWRELSPDAALPTILQDGRKRPFGEPNRGLLNLWQEVCAETGIEFDLLYDARGFEVLLTQFDRLEQPLIYLHCGGLEGNPSMLARYRRLGWLYTQAT